MIFTLLFSVTASAFTVGSLECKAIHRTVDRNNKTQETVQDMPITFAANGAVKYQLEMNGRYFSVTEQVDQSLMGQIISGPEFTKGPVSRGLPDARGQFNLAEVDGTTVFKIECKQLPKAELPRINF